MDSTPPIRANSVRKPGSAAWPPPSCPRLRPRAPAMPCSARHRLRSPASAKPFDGFPDRLRMRAMIGLELSGDWGNPVGKKSRP